jgi:hypothetical protein
MNILDLFSVRKDTNRVLKKINLLFLQKNYFILYVLDRFDVLI